MSTTRHARASKHASIAHYCHCGFVGFGNGAEWSHERKHTNLAIGPVRWVTREWWEANIPKDRRHGQGSIYAKVKP